MAPMPFSPFLCPNFTQELSDWEIIQHCLRGDGINKEGRVDSRAKEGITAGTKLFSRQKRVGLVCKWRSKDSSFIITEEEAEGMDTDASANRFGGDKVV